MSDEANQKLARAAFAGDLPGARAALREGADPNSRGEDGLSPLHRVALAGLGGADPEACLSIQAALHKAGADPSLRDARRHVASHYWPNERFRVANLAQAFFLKGDEAALSLIRIGGKSLSDWRQAEAERARRMASGRSM